MALKTILDSLDGVDDAFKDQYEEKDGKFVLQIEGIDDHPAVVSLRNGHNNSKRERDEARRKLTEAEAKLRVLPEGFDIAEYERLKAEDEARQADPDNKDVRKQVETAVAAKDRQWQARHEAAMNAKDVIIAERDGTIESLGGDLRRTLVEDGLTKALVKAGIKPTLMKAAQRMFEGDVEVVEEDGKRVARMKTDLGGDEVERFIMNWSQSEEAKDFIAPMRGADERGSDTRRNAGPNPFAKDGWNITQQGRLINSDRAKAEQLAKAAGFKDLDEANKAVGPKAA
ncbi:hypothetical protein C7441_11032 [Pseudaminobacter salicylatoxidans]|uniref:Phage protein n=1 Tax=Pseudaminobacter salicylatoxidans TaxID=93369 RepID=A0A316C0H0_PSESE|nr:hypothetical protein [Pseudaminobacter salicylatoxidans]PWJ81500.1 hypothetical protein C7441_11032 [Pseudaminobacter salicylatoxidans]